MAFTTTFSLERTLWRRGLRYVAGVDEVGRGAWAGPLIAAAVILHDGKKKRPPSIVGIRDSKTLTPKARQRLFQEITDKAVAWSIGMVSPQAIDRFGIVAANRLAMKRAVAGLSCTPEYLLVDAFAFSFPIPSRAVPLGDDRVSSIAAASIVAKVIRDALMVRMHRRYPHYGFPQHKGYGTAMHQRALKRHGLCPLHRRTFLSRVFSPYQEE